MPLPAKKRQRTSSSWVPTAPQARVPSTERAVAGLLRGRSAYLRMLRPQASGVQGTGLFARDVIQQGEFVCDYYGARVPRWARSAADCVYEFELNGSFFLDPYALLTTVSDGDDKCADRFCGTWRVQEDVAGYAVARYINHSCSPNLAAVRIGLRREAGLSEELAGVLRLPLDPITERAEWLSNQAEGLLSASAAGGSSATAAGHSEPELGPSAAAAAAAAAANNLERNTLALAKIEQCLQLQPSRVWAWAQKARALRQIGGAENNLEGSKAIQEGLARAAANPLERCETRYTATQDDADGNSGDDEDNDDTDGDEHYDDDDDDVIVFFASRQITAGEELTFDYARACATTGAWRINRPLVTMHD